MMAAVSALLAGLPEGGGPWETVDPGRLGRAQAFYFALIAAGLAANLVLALRWQIRPVDWAARARRLAARPWQERDAFALLVLLAVGVPVAALLARLAGLDGTPGALPIQAAVLGGAVLVYAAVALRARGAGLRRGFGVRVATLGRDAGAGVVCYLAALPYLATFSLLYRLLLQRAGVEAAPQPILEVLAADHPPALRLLLFALAVGFVPVIEEALFRGIAQPLAARRLGMSLAVVLVAAVFALLHRHPVTFVPLFVLAVVLSVGYLRTGSLVTPTVAHALFNAVNLGVLVALR